MSLPHRQTIKFTAPQYVWLLAEAERLGVSLADLVRRIIDDYRRAAILKQES
jgi:hypothetical protein